MDEATQYSGGEQPSVDAVTDNSSTAPTTVAASEQGSPATQSKATQSAQEQRDVTAIWSSLSEAEKRKLIEKDPLIKDHIARRSKSDADKAASRIEAQYRQQYQQWWEAEQIRRQREAMLSKDPYEAGEEYLKALREQKEWEEKIQPYLTQAQQQAAKDARAEGYNKAFSEINDALAATFPHYRAMSQEEQRSFIRKYQSFAEMATALLEEGVSKRTEAELNKRLKELQARQAKEQEIENRASESPDTGEGVPIGGTGDFIRDFASGRSNDFARARKFLGI